MSRIVRFLAALVTLLALAGVAGLGTLGVMRARTAAMDHADSATRDRAKVIAAIVRDAVQSDENGVGATAGQRPFHLAVVARNYAAAGPYLVRLITAHPRFNTVAVYDAQGRLAARIPYDRSIAGRRFGQQSYFSKARAQGFLYASDLFVQLGRPNSPVIAYSIRIFHGNSVHGVLVATIPISTFDTIVQPLVPPGWVARLYNTSGERVSPSSEASGKSYSTDAIVGPALSGRSSVHRVGGSGGSIVAAEPISDIGWAVVISQPTRLTAKETRDLTERLSLLAGGSLVLAMVAAAIGWLRRPRRAP